MKRAGLSSNSLVMLASANKSIRDQWSSILSAYPQCVIDDRIALEHFVESGIVCRPAIILCDEHLIKSGRDPLLLQLNRMPGNVPVLVLTAGPPEMIDLEWLRCGVRGCCSWMLEDKMLRKAVTTLLMGETWLPRRLIASFIASLNANLNDSAVITKPDTRGKNKRLSKLTAREREVTKLVTDGLNNKLIARQLDVTERTIKAHLSNIFQKLGIENRVMLALAFKNHL